MSIPTDDSNEEQSGMQQPSEDNMIRLINEIFHSSDDQPNQPVEEPAEETDQVENTIGYAGYRIPFGRIPNRHIRGNADTPQDRQANVLEEARDQLLLEGRTTEARVVHNFDGWIRRTDTADLARIVSEAQESLAEEAAELAEAAEASGDDIVVDSLTGVAEDAFEAAETQEDEARATARASIYAMIQQIPLGRVLGRLLRVHTSGDLAENIFNVPIESIDRESEEAARFTSLMENSSGEPNLNEDVMQNWSFNRFLQEVVTGKNIMQTPWAVADRYGYIIKNYETKAAALVSVIERNRRALGWGLGMRYNVVKSLTWNGEVE